MYTHKSAGLFIIRLVLGAIFLMHGIQKLQHMDMTVGFFNQIGFAAFWAWVVAIVETLAGVMMVLGFWTGIAGLLLAIVMLVAMVKVKLPMGGIQAAEIDLMLLASSLGIALTGPGRWALCRSKKCSTCTSCTTCDCETPKGDTQKTM